MSSADVAQYIAKQDASRAAICRALQKSIDAGLPGASPKLWHGIPVWFVGENPAVGFTARKIGVMLMFWNGQHFDEPDLEPSGSFHMAQKAYNDASEIDEVRLAAWLQKAGSSVWDLVGERNAFVAKRKVEKAAAKRAAKPAAKPKGEDQPKSKAGAKAKAKANGKASAKSEGTAKGKGAAKGKAGSKATSSSKPRERRPARAKAKK